MDVFARADTLERESFLFSGWRVALAFAVDNLDEILQQLKSQGVAITCGVEEDSDSRWVMFNAPGGNLLEVAIMGNNKRHP